jgi:hypothetical protein
MADEHGVVFLLVNGTEYEVWYRHSDGPEQTYTKTHEQIRQLLAGDIKSPTSIRVVPTGGGVADLWLNANAVAAATVYVRSVHGRGESSESGPGG